MDIGLMVEGQNGLTWERWRHILALAERLEFPSLFRSDHYFLSPASQQDSLEAYVSFVAAALETKRLRFGPLVTPITFREPVNVARMAAQIDVLSGGRFVMRLGAGWNEAEHRRGRRRVDGGQPQDLSWLVGLWGVGALRPVTGLTAAREDNAGGIGALIFLAEPRRFMALSAFKLAIRIAPPKMNISTLTS